MNDFIFKSVIAVLIVLLFLTSMIWFVNIHEMVHVQVAERAGCQTGEVNWLPSNPLQEDENGIGVALAGVNYSCSEYQTFEEVSDMQDIVDIVGYQLFPIYFVLILILLLQIKSGFFPAKNKCCIMVEEFREVN